MSNAHPAPPYRQGTKRRLAYLVHRRRVLWRLRRQGADVALWQAWQAADRAAILARKPEDYARAVSDA